MLSLESFFVFPPYIAIVIGIIVILAILYYVLRRISAINSAHVYDLQPRSSNADKSVPILNRNVYYQGPPRYYGGMYYGGRGMRGGRRRRRRRGR